jgi:hypothetical protein
VDVEVHLRVVRDGAKEFLDKLHVECADFRAAILGVVRDGGPAGEIDGHVGEGFFHRKHEKAVTPDAAFVADGLRDRFTQADADVFHRVVIIDVQIALGVHGEIEEAMPADVVEHVIKETDARGHIHFTRAIQIDRQLDLRFLGIAADDRAAR